MNTVAHTVGEGWLRAYAASIGDVSAPLFDLDRDSGIIAHPVFPVCLEWPLITQGPPGLGLDDAAVHAGLHVSHQITWHRPIRPGDVLVTSIELESLTQRSIGALATFAFATRTPGGEPVVDTRQGILYLGSTVNDPAGSAGGETHTALPTSVDAGTLEDVGDFTVGEADAVLYTECSGIWNPIHTDPRAARDAGLPRPVLHGTATLARVASQLVAARAGGDPTTLRSLSCRFTAPVVAGDHVTVAASSPRPETPAGTCVVVDFVARAQTGTTVLDGGGRYVAQPPR